MTGGVTSELFAADILDKDKFWADELMNVNKLFLFGLAQMGGRYGERRGIIEKHAYSIMEARELDNFRLLKIRYTSVPPGSYIRSCVSTSHNSARDGAGKVAIENLRSLTQSIGIHGARRNGMVLGATGLKNGHLIACAGLTTNSAMTAFVTPLITFNVRLIVF